MSPKRLKDEQPTSQTGPTVTGFKAKKEKGVNTGVTVASEEVNFGNTTISSAPMMTVLSVRASVPQFSVPWTGTIYNMFDYKVP